MPVRRPSSYSDAVLAPSVTLALVLAAAGAAPPAIPLAAGRTTTVRVPSELGASIEAAVPGRAFARAAAMDGEQRWSAAAALYADAIAEWTTAARARPSPALDRAIEKAEHERQLSMLLATTLERRPPGRVPVNPLEEGHLLRGKLMVARAARGHAPPELAARARAAFDEALRAAGAPRPGIEAEVRLGLCATRAAAGDRAGARLERAHVTSAERADLDNALPLALCAAALGEDAEALARLEMFVLRPTPHPLDPSTLRELYLANDWDRLRGQPRFESLFRAALPP